MEKRQRRGLFWFFFAHMFLLVLSPDPVDNRITVFE